MNDDDDDFWTTYIASTPEEDQQFSGVGKGLLIFAAIVGVIVLLTILLH